MLVRRGKETLRVSDRLQDHHDLAKRLHPQDRVGTYACFRIADVVS